MRMRLPYLAPCDPVPPDLSPCCALVQAVAPQLPVASLHFNDAVGYLVIRLEDGCLSPEGLQALTVPPGGYLMTLLPATPANHHVKAIILACRSQGGVVISRFFAPWLGIDEDPFTGSAHAVLAPLFLEDRRQEDEDEEGGGGGGGAKTRLVCRQMSQRTGDVVCSIVHDERKGVILQGSAVVVAQGTMLIPH